MNGAAFCGSEDLRPEDLIGLRGFCFLYSPVDEN